ncbi:MAG: hypothetical protein K2J99_15705 [Lachnospiraceae bacterium]|nr:hypothetical protein [Lachnospiraceae bacterium]
MKVLALDPDLWEWEESAWESGVVTIMMSLFNHEQIMETYWKDMAHTKDRGTAERMIRKGKMTLEDIADCVPSLSFDELREIEAEVMQSA